MTPDMHDSGKRQSFDSGAVRDSAEGKPRPDLISPHANLREGAWLGIGALKYDERNWEAGIPISRCIASLERHLLAYKLGLQDEDHMAAIRTNAGFILHYEEEIAVGRLDPKWDDMPHYADRPGSYFDYVPVEPQVVLDGPHAGATVYIAGPMRGLPECNFPAFDEATEQWRGRGYTVISPAEMDRECSFDPNQDASLTDVGEVIERDVLAIIRELRPGTDDGIALLSGWEESKGAMVEIALGQFLGLKFYNAHTGEKIVPTLTGKQP